MKKITTILLTALVSMIFFSGCKDAQDEILPPMNGFWRCESIGGTAFGVNTPAIENKYLNLFSIGYVGLAGTGYYTRTGTTDLADASSAVSTITNPLGNTSDWSNFMTSGTFTYEVTAKTVTHSLKNGETETFLYDISSDGNTLTLTTQTASTSTGNEVTSVVGALNSILSTIGANTINTSVGVVYTYKKSTITEIVDLINSSTSN